MAIPTLVVVSGPAGSGKTTLAHELARMIGCPAICRDEIKEGMAHARGQSDPAPGDELTQRTLPLFFGVIRVLVAGGVSVVAEAAFQDPVWRPNLEELRSFAKIRVVQCHADRATARERIVERAGSRAMHADSDLIRSLERSDAYFDSFERLAIPMPSLDVDTTDGYSPPIADIAAFASQD